MCFGTEASFIAAGVLSTIGILTVKLKKPKTYLPLALTPFIFAIQQAIEGIVWLSFSSSYLQLFSYFYLFFALFCWPIWIPFVFLIPETNPLRKKLLFGLLLLGILMDLYYIYSLNNSSMDVKIVHHSIQYFPSSFSLRHVLYLASTLIPMFLSTLRWAWIYGIMILFAYLISVYLLAYAFVSVWCFFSAIASLFIYLLIHKNVRQKRKS